MTIQQQALASNSDERISVLEQGRHTFHAAPGVRFIVGIVDVFHDLGHRGARAAVPTKALPSWPGIKVFPIGLVLVALVLFLSACGSSGSVDTSGAGQTLRNEGQTMMTNAGVMRDSGQMMLDNGQAMTEAGQTVMNRGKTLSQDDMVSLGQQMMDKGKAMRAAGQTMMDGAQTMMTDGQQMVNRGQGMMGG